MSQPERCPECGAKVPTAAPEGLCPKCLMRVGFDSQGVVAKTPSRDTRTTHVQPADRVPLEPAELARYFPNLEIECLIGQGGMGAVYKARQLKLDRPVALKVIKPESYEDPAFAERFNREARTLARLNHPNIVAVHDFGEAGQLYYFIMEFVDGANLRQLLETQQLEPEQALAVAPQICDALQFAHGEGVVHRDIKPENILLDRTGRVKIADFGLAKLVANSAENFTLTGRHQVMGTPRYMAPEQMEGSHQVDHRADIYSLGVVFYEMLTGQVPVGHFDPPSKKVEIDVRLDEVVLRSMAREPDRRYQKASEVSSRVNAIQTDSVGPVSAAEIREEDDWFGPERIIERVRRKLRLRRIAFRRVLTHPVAPGVLAILLSLGGVATIFVPWAVNLEYGVGLSEDPWLHAYDHSWGRMVGAVFLVLALTLFAVGTLREIPVWRPWTIMLTGVVTLALVGLFYETTLVQGQWRVEGSFHTALGLSIALMLVGAWVFRCLLARDVSSSGLLQGVVRQPLDKAVAASAAGKVEAIPPLRAKPPLSTDTPQRCPLTISLLTVVFLAALLLRGTLTTVFEDFELGLPMISRVAMHFAMVPVTAMALATAIAVAAVIRHHQAVIVCQLMLAGLGAVLLMIYAIGAVLPLIHLIEGLS